VPLKDTLSGIHELYKQGAFKRFGLSNFLAQQVEEIIAIAKENDFVLPTVYQGNYNAVARRADDEVFPVLRKHGIAFYAYSPIAGGFLSKSKADLVDPKGRFGDGNNPLSGIYNGMYNRPSFVAALDAWEQIAKDEGVSRAELAYRWVVYHSKLQAELGDAIIVGARTAQQLTETVASMAKGPLSDAAVEKIDQVWESVKAEASLDNFEPYGRV
jgi:aflatoxin B1 aldehyde reductase